jgi:hypothetical protein
MWLMPAVSKTISMKSGDPPQVRLQSALMPQSKCAGLLNTSATFGMRGFVSPSDVHTPAGRLTG